MALPHHLCPFGLKAKDRLEQAGYEVEDHLLESWEETDDFMKRHGVKTTPQVFVEGVRIGGYDDLRRFLGDDVPGEDETTYRPVLWVFATAAAIAFAAGWEAFGGLAEIRIAEWFAATAMTLLALLKLQDVESFSTMFLNYDLLGRRWVRYAYFYPYAEFAAGVLMIAGVGLWLAAPLALFIGSVGAASVFKAVYVDKRELKCACVGGASRTPLGAVSLTENLVMVAMGLWMLPRAF